MAFNHFIDQITKRNWTKDLIHKYIGEYKDSWFLFANSEKIRNNAGSGGVVTALLKYLLDSNQIDGALVLGNSVSGNQIIPEYQIVTDSDDLLNYQGSKYITTNFTHDAIPLIKEFKGKLALLLLPCDTWVINRMRKNDPELDEKIKFTFALFCGHVSDPELSQLVVKKSKPLGKSLIDFRYRVGHWRGKMQLTYEGDPPIEKPFSYFSDYQNLYFFCARKCLRCSDHTGYECDLSIGDVWLMSMKEIEIKHNAVICRTEPARDLVKTALDSQVLGGYPVDIEMIAAAQSRSLPLHYNVTARSKAGKLLGVKITDTVIERVRLVDFLIALILIFNYKISTNPKGQFIISRLPRKVIKMYLYFLKALEIL